MNQPLKNDAARERKKGFGVNFLERADQITIIDSSRPKTLSLPAVKEHLTINFEEHITILESWMNDLMTYNAYGTP